MSIIVVYLTDLCQIQCSKRKLTVIYFFCSSFILRTTSIYNYVRSSEFFTDSQRVKFVSYEY
jgi:hypothetical protein